LFVSIYAFIRMFRHMCSGVCEARKKGTQREEEYNFIWGASIYIGLIVIIGLMHASFFFIKKLTENYI
jgi:Na+-driven multidrug efflux pump